MTAFNPDIWTNAAAASLRRTVDFGYNGRKRHSEFTPHSAEHLAERAAAVHAWEALTDELLSLGYLAYENSYECQGFLGGDDSDGTYEIVWDETEEEYAERLAQMPAIVTFPVVR